MIKKYFILLIAIAFTGVTYGQNLLNAKSPNDVTNKNLVDGEDGELTEEDDSPMDYGYINDRDIMWSTTVWEIVDLNEQLNLPYYFPIDTMNIGIERRSLFDALLLGISKGEITEVYSDDYFTARKSLSEINESLTRIDTLDIGYEQYNAGEEVYPEYIVKQSLTSRDIVQYKIKGIWYFDKRNGEMKYRLLAIAPVSPDVNEMDSEEPDMVELFWVWYPDAREVLNRTKVFNPKNTSFSLSFDNILNARRFIGIIYKEDNVYGDRKISDYIKENAMFQLLEADQVKNNIRDFEMDLWSY
ncbi:MAG: gliding motility protein GldN [Flavobacteriales bacterium]|nr:gliding motility protein GldN [Flavobacteriales bacterium]